MGHSSVTDFLRMRFIRGANWFFRITCIAILSMIAIHAEANTTFSNEQASLKNGNYYPREAPIAFAQSDKKISIQQKDISVAEALKIVERQSKMKVSYNASELKGKKVANLNLQNASVPTALETILKGTGCSYQIQGNNINIKSNRTAQKIKNVKGNVTDEHGEPLIGVNVYVEGSTTGATTDLDGNFTIKAPENSTLEISYIGYLTQKVIISQQDFYAVQMQPDAEQLNEVVVTALGLKQEEKALSYNVQQVKGDELTRVKNANFMTSLVGKVAGVTINSSSAGVGSATRVVMRGTKSINYNNNALYAIDGIPITNSGGSISDMFSSTTSTDDISNLNPDDIESISVLTGAAAASLYGSLGQNGVVLITTKSGEMGKPRLTYSNSSTFHTPFVLPRFQNTYGQTEPGSFESWGEKLSKPSDYSPRDFFQTGQTISHSVTFSAGTKTNKTYASAQILNAEGIIPSNKLDQYNFSLRNTMTLLNDKLTVGFNVMLSRQKTKNMFAQGLYHNPLVPIYLFPPGGNFNAIKAYERYNESRNFPTQYWPFADNQFRMENPYWITNREHFTRRADKLFAGANLEYQLFNWLKLQGRAKVEYTNSKSETDLYASTNTLFAGTSGRYQRSMGVAEQYYFDVMANIDKTFNEKFTITGNLGYSFTENKNQSMSVNAYLSYGTIPNLFNTGNSRGEATSMLPSRRNYQALYANAELSYKRMLYLNGSVRSDWWSQLYGTGQMYIIYPSVGVSAILTEMFNFESKVLSFLKVRANYTDVGNPPPAYVTGIQTYPVTVGSPDFGNGIKPSLTLQPEKTRGIEAGLNLKMFDYKLNLDVTLYKTKTYNQIFNVPISTSSFYSSFYINAGQVTNKGIEAALGYKDTFRNLTWESNVTFTLNRNRVDKLIDNYYDEESQQYITRDLIEKGGAGSYSMKVSVGGTLGDVYVSTLQMDDQGRYVVVSNGKVFPDDQNIIYAGKTDPNCTVGFNNTFSWKNFDLSFNIFGRFGGIGVSATQAMLDAYGVSEETAKARDRGYIMLNGKKYTSISDYYKTMGNGINGILSEYVYSATNIRLKSLSIGYTIPGRWLWNKVSSIHVALTGENLFMFYNKAPFDPESTASTGTYYQGIDYFMQPSLRSMGFSVKIRF